MYGKGGSEFQLPLNSGSFQPEGGFMAVAQTQSFSCLLTAALFNGRYVRYYNNRMGLKFQLPLNSGSFEQSALVRSIRKILVSVAS